MTDLETLLVGRAGGVVTVTLNRPEKKNAINGQMWDELLAVLAQIAHNPSDRAVVVTGAGGDFCSGADLSTVLARTDRTGLDLMRQVGDVAAALHGLPKPTLAKVRGVAVGAGWNLALACDLVIAAPTARFSQIFSRRGLAVDGGGSWLLPRLIGLQKAKELVFLAEMLSAAEVAELRLVNRVVPDDELDGFVDDWAARLAGGPTVALSLSKSLLNESFESSFGQAVEGEARSQQITFATHDVRVAMEAFATRSTPDFTGR